MKKTITIIYCLCMLHNFSIAQDEKTSSAGSDNKFYVALSGGAAMPVGNFGKSNIELSTESGYAKVGYNFNLNSGYQIGKAFGIGGTFFYSKFRINESAINDFLDGGSGVTVSADHWQYYGVQIGPTATLSLTKDIYLDFKAFGGIAHVNMPIIELKGSNGSNVNIGFSKEKWSDAFSWQLGSQLRYNFVPKFFLYTSADYNYMKPTWSIGNEDVNQKMGVVDINIGLGANF